VSLKPFCRDDSSNRDEYSPQTLHSQQVNLMWFRLEGPCRIGSPAPDSSEIDSTKEARAKFLSTAYW